MEGHHDRPASCLVSDPRSDEPPGAAVHSRHRGHADAPAIDLTDGTGRLADAKIVWVRGYALRALKHLGLVGECRVRLAPDVEVADAHRRHLGVPGTTDVITFDLTDPSQPGSMAFLDVDLLVCLDEAERQARDRGGTVERELVLYILHGVLHCLGHDDHDEESARAMHEREDEILCAIGVGPVYAAPSAGPGSGA